MAEVSYEVPSSSDARNTAEGKVSTALTKIKETVNGKIGNVNLESGTALANLASSSVTNAKLATEAKPVVWYTPKVIATEETRESASFGTLTTADQIASVVLPTNGLFAIGYVANIKSSVSAAGKVAIFIGATQLKVNGEVTLAEAHTEGTAFHRVGSYYSGLSTSTATPEANVTTGEVLSNGTTAGGVCYVFAAAGTYTISVQYKATSGTVTAKERKLWVYTLGV